jgi:anti-sigma factor RsiW
MSRDQERERADELMSAYVDGVAELASDERHAVERRLADDPAARAEAGAVQSLLGQLRALPPSDGDEPDWMAMERSIHQAVAAVPVRPWWRRWQWLVPAMTCATAAALLVVLWPRTQGAPVRLAAEQHPTRPAAPPAAAPPAAGNDDFALWLDGQVIEVDPQASPAIDDALREIDPAATAADEPDELALLPATDLAWVDTLDDDALERAERWLASPDADRRMHGEPGPSGQSGPSSLSSQSRKKS